MLRLLLFSLIVVGLCVAGLAIKLLIRRDGTFSHRCAMRESDGEAACGSCSPSGRHEDCPHYELHHGHTASQMAKASAMAEEV
ncbi:MAG: hypothetical protein K2L50_01420 [Bacteroidales bacterium]|nr:hypothetical protein [Bacteroidales bacterium]